MAKHLRAALTWIERFGDRDGDGFVEYERRAARGLLHQGWKDSDDAIVHADGSIAEGPIALAEVQGYIYAALRAGAALACALGELARARELDQRAERLFERFDRAFWREELGMYALALDGRKRPCLVRSSNAGQCLFTGIATPERAARLARTLVSPELFSGWGVRTLANDERRYNPLGYHNGAVWPHDNALIALGLARYGYTREALAICAGLLGAGSWFDLQRMPELFCGFARRADAGPVSHPVACAPQAWAAGSVLLLLQACLGLEIDAVQRRVTFAHARLPDAIDELRIHELALPGATLDLAITRETGEIAVSVLRQQGAVELRVMP